jgi:mono/diheme cytochrome c family protein
MFCLHSRFSCLAFAFVGAAAATLSCGSPGSSDSAPKSTEIPAVPGKSPANATSGGPADGATLFAQNCVQCHGDKGTGGRRAPKLAGRKTLESEASNAITNGKGRMPSFKTRLQPDQIAAIAKYVSTL